MKSFSDKENGVVLTFTSEEFNDLKDLICDSAHINRINSRLRSLYYELESVKVKC